MSPRSQDSDGRPCSAHERNMPLMPAGMLPVKIEGAFSYCLSLVFLYSLQWFESKVTSFFRMIVPENVLYSLKNQGERMFYVSDLLGK